MRRAIRWFIGLPIALIVIAFAVANRRWVTLSLDPFSTDAPIAAIDLPLWLLFFAGIFVGIVVGWTACWFAQGKWRKATRDYKTEVVRLHRELAAVQKPVELPSSQDATPFTGGLL